MDRVLEQIGADQITQTGKGICVAVLDTGVSVHPDLKGRIKYFKDFVRKREHMYDDNSHGTHICGILCGSGAMSRGMIRGIAPETEIVMCKILNEKGDGCAEDMLEALLFVDQYKNALGIRILNISVGIGELKDQTTVYKLQKAVEKLWEEGMIVVCAAGNKGPADGSISAVCNSTKVITVGCHDGEYYKGEQDRCEIYSGRGERFAPVRKPDLVAPGTKIYSCNGKWSERIRKNEQFYEMKTGTSMATPIVSGSIALLLEKEPWLSPDQVKERVLFSATDLGEDWNKQGWGMINTKRLLDTY